MFNSFFFQLCHSPVQAGVDVALHLAKRLSTLRLEDATASVQKDKDMMLGPESGPRELWLFLMLIGLFQQKVHATHFNQAALLYCIEVFFDTSTSHGITKFSWFSSPFLLKLCSNHKFPHRFFVLQIRLLNCPPLTCLSWRIDLLVSQMPGGFEAMNRFVKSNIAEAWKHHGFGWAF